MQLQKIDQGERRMNDKPDVTDSCPCKVECLAARSKTEAGLVFVAKCIERLAGRTDEESNRQFLCAQTAHEQLSLRVDVVSSRCPGRGH
ncbi:MAG: hypothetical protein Q7T51_00340 [Candidatus Moranbacteria bacterium]|nr:hypothetical protein [Candidatus Moranbacteria bacterium]